MSPALAFEYVHINASLTSLLRFAPVLDGLELHQPVIQVRQDAEGRWGFVDVVDKL